ALFDLDHATNDRLLGETGLLPGIGIDELVLGVPGFRIANAAFGHAQPLGGRCNGPDHGAWYAAADNQTPPADVEFHEGVELAEVGWAGEESVTYDDYLADFSGELHDIRGQDTFAACLDPDSYMASQALAERLLAEGALGIAYPSVRRPPGDCL